MLRRKVIRNSKNAIFFKALLCFRFKATFLLSARGRCLFFNPFPRIITHLAILCHYASSSLTVSAPTPFLNPVLVFSTSIIHPAPYEAVQAVSQIAISSLNPLLNEHVALPPWTPRHPHQWYYRHIHLIICLCYSFHYFLEINFNLSSHVYYSTIHLMYFCRCNSVLVSGFAQLWISCRPSPRYVQT